MKELDHKKSINIAIGSILDSMQSGKEEIFAITEQIEKENRAVKSDISQIKKMIKTYSTDIENIKKRELQSRIRLSEVSSDFQQYTSDDIQVAYEESYTIQKDLFEKQTQIKNILASLEQFESKIQKNNDLVSKADDLLNKIEVMSEYMRLDTNSKEESSDIFARWMAFQEKEKSRIARDIHDGPAQTMASLVIKSDIIKKLIEKESPNKTIYNELEQLKIQLRNVIKEIRQIMYDLRPTSLDELGFTSSVEGLISKVKENKDIEFELNIKEKSEISSSNIKIISFRVVQEVLNNISKHSQAKKVNIEISINKNYININIEDDGIGFDVKNMNSSKSFGLSSLKERVYLVEGTIDIISKIGKGTIIKVRIPNKEDVYA